MNDVPERPERRWMPWWSLPAGMGLGLLALAALLVGLLFVGWLLALLLDAATQGGWSGTLAVLLLWGAYVLCLAIYRAKRFWRLLAAAAVGLIIASLVLAQPLDEGALLLVPGLLLGVSSHAMLMIAAASLRYANRLVDPEHWARHRLARGLCPECGYDIRGLPHCRCPECGTTWSDDELSDEAGVTAAPPRLP